MASAARAAIACPRPPFLSLKTNSNNIAGNSNRIRENYSRLDSGSR